MGNSFKAQAVPAWDGYPHTKPGFAISHPQPRVEEEGDLALLVLDWPLVSLALDGDETNYLSLCQGLDEADGIAKGFDPARADVAMMLMLHSALGELIEEASKRAPELPTFEEFKPGEQEASSH